MRNCWVIGLVVLVLGVFGFLGLDCVCGKTVTDYGSVLTRQKGNTSSTYHVPTYRLTLRTEKSGDVTFETNSHSYEIGVEGSYVSAIWRQGCFTGWTWYGTVEACNEVR